MHLKYEQFLNIFTEFLKFNKFSLILHLIYVI
jgi:hypothetical protein